MSKRVLISYLLCLGFLAGCQTDSNEPSETEDGVLQYAPSLISDILDIIGLLDVVLSIHVESQDGSVSDLISAGVLIQFESWNQKYSFEIKCHDDADGQQQIAILTVSEDENYHAIHQVQTVVCQNGSGNVVVPIAQNNANAALNIQPDVLTMGAGQNGSFDISLAQQPTEPVVVMALPLTDAHELSSVIFTNDACFSQVDFIVINTQKTDTTFEIDALSECVHDFDDLLTIHIVASSLIKPEDLQQPDPATENDGDDNSGDDGENPNEYFDQLAFEQLFELDKTYLSVRDSGSYDGFTIRLLAEPDEDVVISFTSTEPNEINIQTETLVFTSDNWSTPQTVTINGVSDGINDGPKFFDMKMSVVSEDPTFDGIDVSAVYVQTIDDDSVAESNSFKFRVMAANITSGKKQAYSPGHGIRIFQAVKPDIVLINEFNMYSGTKDTDADIRTLVDKAFGSEFYYHHGNGNLPNGIVSRYPIKSSGGWKSNIINNRDWDWAVIDIPGDKDLLAISVHLSTEKNAQEMPLLINEIQKKIDRDAKQGFEYYVVIGGDFNTTTRKTVTSNLSSVFVTSAPYPVDQNGNDYTNAKRTSPYDWLLCNRDLCKKEIPVEIGAHTGADGYNHGHVFDSRVYGKYSVTGPRDKEISYVAPAQANDSGASNMQHMAVIRDFEILY